MPQAVLTPRAIPHEVATLRGVLLLARDMLAQPHRFSWQDRSMLVETLEMISDSHTAPPPQSPCQPADEQLTLSVEENPL